MSHPPIKRHPALQQLSRDHHYGLLLCWKIRQGLQKGTAPERIFRYALHFFETDLQPHFKEEEENVFPLVKESNPLVQTALGQHAVLYRLFSEKLETADLPARLRDMADKLEEHIRFEERTLFQEIQALVPEEVLARLSEKPESTAEKSRCDVWDDPFWEKEVV